MPDSNIGSLPQVAGLNDESLMVVEQQGQAMKMTGAQFKDFGKQGLIADMQGYVDAAEQAANSAKDAVSAVADMTVEAHTLENGQNATVSKAIHNGVFNLSFGLPRGEQGIQGPEGRDGPRGPKGDPGSGLKILGYYEDLEALDIAHPLPNVGDAYGIGVEPPYDIYVFDGVSGQWKNNGPLSGGGSILPEDVVTSAGGAEIAFSGLGDAPFAIEINDEEEPPLSAGDIAYKEDKSVEDALEGLFTSVGNGKALIASAITDKGVPTEDDAAFADMAENIQRITTGASTEDATATPGDILAPKTAYTATGKVEGLIPTLQGRTITPGTADQMIAIGQYIGGTQIIKGDTNLVSSNIKKGVSIFGVAGAVEQNFMAVLTVTVDVGAVVTAKNGDTEVSALSTTGKVTLELPIEGQWIVTAVRGVAQYNTVTINVTSSYTATLTAELHIEYHGEVEQLEHKSQFLAATTVGNYALFGGGNPTSSGYSGRVNAYTEQLVRTTPDYLGMTRNNLAATTVGECAIFAGGFTNETASKFTDYVDSYDKSLVHGTPSVLSEARSNLAATSIGNYALFGGGKKTNTIMSAVVDAYDTSLTRTTPTALALNEMCQAASNSNYAIFCNTKATAYDATLTRTMPTAPQFNFPPSSLFRLLAAARAGSYVVFEGFAYDLFLTMTIIDTPFGEVEMGSTTLKDHAVMLGEGDSNRESVLTIYDPYLVRTSIKPNACMPRRGGAAAAVGNYALFGGGYRIDGSGITSTVNAFKYK